jgi:hypothetical protein
MFKVLTADEKRQFMLLLSKLSGVWDSLSLEKEE